MKACHMHFNVAELALISSVTNDTLFIFYQELTLLLQYFGLLFVVFHACNIRATDHYQIFINDY